LGQRSRKRGRREKAPAPKHVTRKQAAMAAVAAERPRRLSGEERNAAVRAALRPLAPGERPRAITIGAVLALLSGGVQLVLFIFGVRLHVAGTHAKAGSTIVFGLMMFICAAGMWRLRYWAVLGFMAILGITVLYFALALVKASSLLGLAIAVVGMGLGGWLFYKLVRALSRIQMPEYPGR
jgi:hypothetical protein